ncbi:MAG TPA: phosphoglycerate dehydrogenase [Candidatus Deferrimicrobiaceae bacterium]
MPEDAVKVLLLENIHPDAGAAFASAGFHVERVPFSPARKVLAQQLGDVAVLGIRSKTRIAADLLDRAPELVAVGAFCIGTEHVDLEACNRRGVAVFNAPYSNTRSVVELALGEMILLLRGVFDRSVDLHRGIWGKTSEGFHEIRGKKLGILGYGNIGSQLSVLAEATGMEVYYHDTAEKLTLGNARKCTLEELLRVSDIVTVHVDGREGNRGLIGEREFSAMKDGVIFLNLSRGFVVDVDALARNLRRGKVRGAAVDVFPEEPRSNRDPFASPLQGIPNVILTPHIGGSTEEAQEGIGDFVAARILEYLATGGTGTSVNFPVLQPPAAPQRHRFAHLHENVPGMLAKINDLFARHGVNISGQRLETRGALGYALIDVAAECDPRIEEGLRRIPRTIRARLVY